MDASERSAIIRKGRILEAEHKQHCQRAAMLLDAQTCWRSSLHGRDRHDRDNVLLALESEKVPDQLQWGSFDRNFGRWLRYDRDIFLRRLDLPSFEEAYKDITYKVPREFVDDKEVMIKIVSKSSKSLSQASAELQNDRQVVMAAIQNPRPCAPLAIQHASKKLQADKRIARTLLLHGHGITAFTLLPRNLQRDYKLALLAIQCSSEECNESFETLSELSEEMVDDYEIVYEAVKRRGSNLRFVTDKALLEDLDIVVAACENDGSAIQYCSDSAARNELLQESNLIVILQNGGHVILNELGDEYMLQSKYLMPAVANGLVLTADFASKLYEKDRPLFMDVLRHTGQPFEQYAAFSDDMRNDSTIGTAILTTNENFAEGSWAFRFSKDIPEHVALIHIDRLMQIAKEEHVPCGVDADLWSEKDIAISLCKIRGAYFSRVSAALKADVDVVKAAFSGRVLYRVILQTPQDLFRQNYDLAAMALEASDVEGIGWSGPGDIYRHFGQQVCSSRAVVVAWLRKGLPTRHFHGLGQFRDDTSVALEVLLNYQGEEVSKLLNYFSSSILGDKAFMMSVVQAHPKLLRDASKELLSDFDFMLQGVSISKEVLVRFSHENGDFDLLADFAMEVRARLEVTDSFVLHFFGASLVPSKHSKRRRTGRNTDDRCHLRMLDLGEETASSIKRKIAEYAGIPVGPQLKLLRAAVENLQYWGY